MKTPLKSGYTTGVHSLLAFCSAIKVFMVVGGKVVSKNHKMDNDDLDVTKGAEIVVTVSESLKNIPLNPKPHQPYIFGKLKIFAGVGVGVVSKDGLKPPKGFPAINPTPLKEIKRCFEISIESIKKIEINKIDKIETIFCSISITDGESIAKNTINKKVGVIGGLSILGTTGFVKPVSNIAFLSSIKTEINFLAVNGYSEAVFTVGNSAFKFAKSRFSETQIVEIGNFIYDSFKLLDLNGVKKVILIAGVAKTLKIAQGFKNTHNRFGSIDFEKLKEDIDKKLEINFDRDMDSTNTKTLKGVLEILKPMRLDERLVKIIETEALKKLNSWFPNIYIELIVIRT